MAFDLLQIRNLSVHYRAAGKVVSAVEGVNLTISESEVIGLLGESGSGKSTLGAAILKLLPENAECEGSIIFRGRDISQMSDRELRDIRGRQSAMVPQDPASSLNPVMRAGAQISEVLRAHLLLSRAEQKKRVLELLREVGFGDPERIAAAYPHQLSGGQRQRVVIAQAIACQPALIIADEPTAKLDAPLQMEILELMSRIVRRLGTALLWITHDPATLVGFADRVLVMHKGQFVEQGSTNVVYRKPAHPYTQELMRLSRDLVLNLPNELSFDAK